MRNEINWTRKFQIISAAAAIAMVFGSVAIANAQIIYDAGIDLRIAELSGTGLGEPTMPVNGVWTYGTSNTADAGEDFDQFPEDWHHDVDIPGGPCADTFGFEGWKETPDLLGDFVPYLMVNTTPDPLFVTCIGNSIAADTFWLHTNPAGDEKEFVVVRWTAPFLVEL